MVLNVFSHCGVVLKFEFRGKSKNIRVGVYGGVVLKFEFREKLYGGVISKFVFHENMENIRVGQ